MAHRLRTIADYDKVVSLISFHAIILELFADIRAWTLQMVLDAGKMVSSRGRTEISRTFQLLTSLCHRLSSTLRACCSRERTATSDDWWTTPRSKRGGRCMPLFERSCAGVVIQ